LLRADLAWKIPEKDSPPPLAELSFLSYALISPSPLRPRLSFLLCLALVAHDHLRDR
jgi:hypothetical protein